ncbi:oxygenase MpaB family protein [uncultured Fibrella sp.]|uniref:oxygenase MpaB family protein n=1 Tax=uncultured Fibrella sp. TaxID=1284596 RepID=UPI0035CCA3F7
MALAVTPTRSFTDTQLAQARLVGDPPADAVIAAVVAQQGRDGVAALMRWLASNTDFDTSGQPTLVQQFFTDYAHLPAWANPDQMRRGMAFYQQHAGVIGLVLGTFSLPYTYLGANGVQLLWLTDRIRTDTARRLQETGEWVFAVNDPKNWGTSSKGILYTLKIRLIHAASRWFGLHTGRWNMEWGMPVCQEDMLGTIGSFGYIVLRGLRKMGVTMTSREEDDYMHHINVVGYLNGVDEELLPHNLREAYHLDKLIVRRQFRPSEAGIGLTRSLLDTIGKQAGSENARNLAAAQMRFFLGNDHADALGIPDVPVESRLMSVVSRLPIFPKLIPTIV